jgi:hypothetical protein
MIFNHPPFGAGQQAVHISGALIEAQVLPDGGSLS